VEEKQPKPKLKQEANCKKCEREGWIGIHPSSPVCKDRFFFIQPIGWICESCMMETFEERQKEDKNEG
jgi:hypothetical protein